jgi:hypothetical protein
MKTPSILAVAAIVAGLASACMVRTETIERPAPATVAVAPAPSTVVYTDTVPATTAVTVTR